MKMVKVLIVGILVLAMSNIAAAAENVDLPKQLMQALAFDSMLEGVRKDTQKMVATQMDGMIAQIQKSNPAIPDSVISEFRTAAQVFGRRICDAWSPSEAAEIYSTALVDGMPENEMRAAIEHYKTPAGQRELKVINDAMNKTNAYIMGSIQKETEAAMKDFLAEISRISQRAGEEAANGAQDADIPEAR